MSQLPFELTATGQWTVTPDEITATAPPQSDIFISPAGLAGAGPAPVLNAATLLGSPPPGDFQLSARVSVDFVSTFDAGALIVWVDDRHWAKLCFEFSPEREPMVVSVVARSVADDANSHVVDGAHVWLRVSHIDRAYAFHASPDGVTWRLIRFFAIDDGVSPVQAGFVAQAPTGDGCSVRFDHVRFSSTRLGDIRDGN